MLLDGFKDPIQLEALCNAPEELAKKVTNVTCDMRRVACDM